MRTSPTQFVIMVEFMERNGDLAKPTGGPRGRQWATNKWRELALKLNSDGTGDSRTEEKWRKVWTDFKNNTKRKAARLNRSMTGTGGGPALKISLTDLELRVLAIMGEQAASGMNTIPEVGFEHVEQEVELASQDDSNQVIPVEEIDFEREPSPQLNIGDEHWNQPGSSQEQPPLVPTPPPTTKWTPQSKKKARKTKNVEDLFLDAERDRDERYFELEKEKIRQRDFELELQAKWLEFMREALSVLNKFLEGKNMMNY